MSENNYEPGKGMHHEDLNALTEYWHSETNYINDNVDSSFKSAQNDAYARGYRRGRDDLIMVRKQRDELLAALELCIPELRGWMNCHGEDIGTIAAINAGKAAIASVKEKK